MEIDIVTLEDLMHIKQEIMDEIKITLAAQVQNQDTRLWFRSAELRKMLNISPGTLQNLRIKGALPYRKIGGSMFYNREDIQAMMEGGKNG